MASPDKQLDKIEKELAKLAKEESADRTKNNSDVDVLISQAEDAQKNLLKMLEKVDESTKKLAGTEYEHSLNEGSETIKAIRAMQISDEDKERLIQKIKSSVPDITEPEASKLNAEPSAEKEEEKEEVVEAPSQTPEEPVVLKEEKEEPIITPEIKDLKDGVVQSRKEYLDALVPYKKEVRVWQGWQKQTISNAANKVMGFFDKINVKKLEEQKHPNQEDVNKFKEKYDEARIALEKKMCEKKREELKGQDPAKVEEEIGNFKLKDVTAIMDQEQTLLNEERLSRLPNKLQEMAERAWAKTTMYGTMLKEDTMKLLAVPILAYQIWGNAGPTLHKFGNYELKVGNLSRTLVTGGAGALFGATGVAIGVRIARGIAVAAGGGIALDSLERKHKAKMVELEAEKTKVENSYKSDNINVVQYQEELAEAQKNIDKAKRKYMLSSYAVMALMAGTNIGSGKLLEPGLTGLLPHTGVSHIADTATAHNVPTPHDNIPPVKEHTNITPAPHKDIPVVKEHAGTTHINKTPPAEGHTADKVAEHPAPKVTSDTTAHKVAPPAEKIKTPDQIVKVKTPEGKVVEIPKEAIIGHDAQHWGDTQVFKAQLEANHELATKLGYPIDASDHEKALFLKHLGEKLGRIGPHGEQILEKANMGQAIVLGVDADGAPTLTEYQHGAFVETHHAGEGFEDKAHQQAYEYTKAPTPPHGNVDINQEPTAKHGEVGGHHGTGKHNLDINQEPAAKDHSGSGGKGNKNLNINQEPKVKTEGVGKQVGEGNKVGNTNHSTVDTRDLPPQADPFDNPEFIKMRTEIAHELFQRPSVLPWNQTFDDKAYTHLKTFSMDAIMYPDNQEYLKQTLSSTEMKYIHRLQEIYNGNPSNHFSGTYIDYHDLTVEEYISKIAEANVEK